MTRERSQGEKGRKGSKGQRGEEKATHYTLSSFSQTQAQHPQQQQSSQQPQQSNRRSGSSSSALAVTDTDTTVMVDNVTVYDTYHRNVDVNDPETKSRFDNVYSCRHFLNDCIMRVSDTSTSCQRSSMR